MSQPTPRPLALAISLMLAACATTRPPPDTAPSTKLSTDRPASMLAAPGPNPATAVEPPEAVRLYRGTGQLVKGQLPGGTLPPPVPAPAPPGTGGGTITLNFEGADLRDVVRSILGDNLGESYTIDPSVGGAVTIRTTSGIPREALYGTLEMLLRSNGAAMVKDGSLWKIVPAANAVRGNLTPQLGNVARALPPGFTVQIVPLKFMGVRQMAALMEPFVKDPQTSVRIDDLRNLLILSGTEVELRHIMEAIDMFDVNWIAGMSVGLFTLQSADVKSLSADLDKAFGTPDKSPLSGILRIIPIERMNAILVITPQAQYLEEARKWIERLDKGGEGQGVRFYVYNVQNSRAERIAPLLQQAFTGRVQQPQQQAAPTVAPGTPAGQIVSPPSFSAQPAVPVANPQPAPTPTPSAAVPGGGGAAPTARAITGGDGGGVVRNIQAVADKDNNTILLVATPGEYAVIEAALKKLDVPQRQVMIEVTIAEVTLTDELDFGVEWLFKGGAPSGRGAGGLFNRSPAFNPGNPTATTTPTTGGGLTNAVSAVGLAMSQGFNYLLQNANFPGGVQAALHLLDTYGSTKVVSNPHLAALDNQKATIKVGNRIPINQQTLVGGTTNAVTTTASYIDTGVLLQVTPHINAGGLVTLDVQAEVSTPGPQSDPSVAPAINTRSVQSLIAVPTGQTMVMGGLITEDKTNSSTGLPVISRIPILGGLFGDQALKNNRTELVLFITPRVVENEIDNRAILDDLRRRMERLEDQFPGGPDPDAQRRFVKPGGALEPNLILWP